MAELKIVVVDEATRAQVRSDLGGQGWTVEQELSGLDDATLHQLGRRFETKASSSGKAAPYTAIIARR
ncbi:hypothetical protein ACQ5SO_14940 [Rhodovulum sp. DZ06]|uniref:hypothetical protein n=1 Tax=Rhodovulum sp. DZ06 TaxID=3425126 RepID=UPI003D3545F2